MPWIIVVPSDEVGGPLRVLARCPESRTFDSHPILSADPGAWPVRYGERAEAEQKAAQLRCGIVVEERPNGDWVLPKL